MQMADSMQNRDLKENQKHFGKREKDTFSDQAVCLKSIGERESLSKGVLSM